ncbi:Protein of unknown function (DUF3037) [Kineococcus xinjiangensis]|uniref:DUF3037 family protein n=1 Tax=Kineococcus xinjiangensis TaxID=512762 RepID=A0A2S6IT21_9ACTN|nr:DUF3037 domain-containing protein [Kineococcus xinjiangensis]PPK97404.1 Protein of unknown function (DUF3037) [Kineococcus xinjiangensis]
MAERSGAVLYEYAVLRVVPRVERAEFLNAGVLLWCRSAEFLGARTGLDEARLRMLAPDADVEAVRRHVEALERVCAGADGAGAPAREAPGQRFRWLTAPRSTVLQTSGVHCGLTRDPAAELERLFGALVGS